MNTRLPVLVLITAFCAAQAVWSLPSVESAKAKRSAVASDLNEGKSAINDKQFHQALLQIPAEYQSYGKVDDMLRWAPARCAAPPPVAARLSSSTDSSTHGKKVYYLFAKSRDDYYYGKPSAVGQVIVKESWLPNPEDLTMGAVIGPNPHKVKGDLFIMYKLDPKSPSTDQGWVYGTATANGESITSAGRVDSCMSCHVMTKNDRLFGLKK